MADLLEQESRILEVLSPTERTLLADLLRVLVRPFDEETEA